MCAERERGAQGVITKADQNLQNAFSELFYLASFGVLLFAKAVGLYDGRPGYKLLLLLGLAFFALKMITTRMSAPEWVAAVLILGMGWLVYHRTGEWGILLYLTMMLGMKNVSEKRVFRLGCVIWSVCLISMAALTESGLLSEMVLVHEKSGFGWIIRHTLGYTHPNVLHVTYLVLMGFLLYSLDEYLNNRQFLAVLVILFLGSIAVFVSSVSFTGMLATTAYLIFSLYFRFRKRISKVEKILILLILPAYLAFMLIGPLVLKGTALYDRINSMLTTRYELTYYFLTQQPITLFGTRFTVPNYRYTMDSSYVYLFMQLGIIPFILVIAAIYALIIDAMKNHRRAELALIFGFLSCGVTEPFLFNSAYKNLIFIFLGQWMYQNLARWSFVQHKGKIVTWSPVDLVIRKRIPARSIWNGICGAVHRLERRVSHFLGILFNTWKKHIAICFLVAAVGMGAGCAVYAAVTVEPSIIYVPEDHMDDHDQPDVVLSEEEQKNLREANGLVIGKLSDGADTLLSQVRDSTKHWEYIRRILDAGIWTAVILAAGYVAAETGRAHGKQQAKEHIS